ncbi:MAG: TauD/TfdA family dioxygenase, partial [Rhizobiales bacterium]|nr:TauD/TfdA family dioxygenase [Hyphomicrobiales bacterium]
MAASSPSFRPLELAPFGVLATIDAATTEAAVNAVLGAGAQVLSELNKAGGLMVVRGLAGLRDAPRELVRISEIFGQEVENYHDTLTAARFFHDEVPEVLVLSNMAPCNHPPPPRPEPALNPDGGLPVQFPQRGNWHTDQSYRRPPPDITLLFGVINPPADQGQTLYADCTAALAALDPELRRKIEGLNGIHAPSWIGRRPEDVLAGTAPKPLLAHQQPQRQPLVRVHPVTGRPSLYICEENQMDHVDGPIEGLEPGVDGEGARLLRQLLAHATQPEFVYVHEWQTGDLVIGDNRCLLHAATWYDAEAYPRLMWRTTVMGTPGAEYRGEAKSWIPQDGHAPMH